MPAMQQRTKDDADHMVHGSGDPQLESTEPLDAKASEVSKSSSDFFTQDPTEVAAAVYAFECKNSLRRSLKGFAGGWPFG